MTESENPEDTEKPECPQHQECLNSAAYEQANISGKYGNKVNYTEKTKNKSEWIFSEHYPQQVFN